MALSCMLVEQGAIIACAVLPVVAQLALHWRRNEVYGLSDALGAGAIGGVCGLALGAALCVTRDAALHPDDGWFGPWIWHFLKLAGLGLIEAPRSELRQPSSLQGSARGGTGNDRCLQPPFSSKPATMRRPTHGQMFSRRQHA